MAEPALIVDTEYTNNFYAHQAPAIMCYVAALNGYAAPRIDREFAYCELGCGNGLTSVALAALHPQSSFYACDLNSTHVSCARALAQAGRVANLSVLQQSFAAMLEEDLPQFDFITLHGVWSWVPESVRGEIRAFLKSKLKPGGLAMVSYNAMPGWAHLQPIRRMMQSYASSVAGDATVKATEAFRYVRFLADNKAAFFVVNPAAAEHLRAIGNADLRYVAHEYLPQGDPFYFADVCAAMHDIGLAFAGNVAPEGNYAELAAGPEFLPLLNTAPTRIVLETHRDFIANTRFRIDLYAAQAEVPRASPLTFERLEGLAFCLARVPEQLPLQGRRGAVSFDVARSEAAVRTAHRVLEAGPATAREIHTALGARSELGTLALLQQLVLAGHLLPCPASSAIGGWSALSSALLDHGIKGNQTRVPLPASRAATMHYFDLPFAVMIEAAGRFKDSHAAVKSVLRRLSDSGIKLGRKEPGYGEAAATDEAVSAELEQMWRNIRDPERPEARFLRLHGVI